ncbi:hypothetical protein KSP39_PZI010378 [Platanthera zijinensis]|uniref:Uncharacterized protein n=1 Tax=Platanthera zijinensis TaxID=2320716 RepID=A0AAP0BKR8_9ASPA
MKAVVHSFAVECRTHEPDSTVACIMLESNDFLLLVHKLDDCVVLLPAHKLGDRTSPSPIPASLPPPRRSPPEPAAASPEPAASPPPPPPRLAEARRLARAIHLATKLRYEICGAEQASVLYCADEAVLCTGYDVRIHSANKLARKHRRFSLQL